jgi:hypothetical protein
VPPAACEATGVDPLEHPAASSPATASVPMAKHVRIVDPSLLAGGFVE